MELLAKALIQWHAKVGVSRSLRQPVRRSAPPIRRIHLVRRDQGDHSLVDRKSSKAFRIRIRSDSERSYKGLQGGRRNRQDWNVDGSQYLHSGRSEDQVASRAHAARSEADEIAALFVDGGADFLGRWANRRMFDHFEWNASKRLARRQERDLEALLLVVSPRLRTHHGRDLDVERRSFVDGEQVHFGSIPEPRRDTEDFVHRCRGARGSVDGHQHPGRTMRRPICRAGPWLRRRNHEHRPGAEVDHFRRHLSRDQTFDSARTVGAHRDDRAIERHGLAGD